MAGEFYISVFISDIFPLVQKHSAGQFITAVVSCLWLTSLCLFLMTPLLILYVFYHFYEWVLKRAAQIKIIIQFCFHYEWSMCTHRYLHREEEREKNLFILWSLMCVCVFFFKLRGMSMENKLAMRAYQLSHTHSRHWHRCINQQTRWSLLIADTPPSSKPISAKWSKCFDQCEGKWGHAECE